jgi:hypothetical protein
MYHPKKHVSEKDGFGKLMSDMITDILTTFPDLDNKDLHCDIISARKDDDDAMSRLKDYCKEVYPERFFDILYENDDIFKDDDSEPVFFLPGVDFGPIWRSTSDENRKIIWKYAKLILFSIVSEISDQNSFGDTSKLFEAIGNDDLKSKLEETIKKMSEMVSEPDTSDKKDSDDDDKCDGATSTEFDAEKLHSHLEGLMGGKLGKLAKDIAEETAKDMGKEFSATENPEELFKNMLKDPSNIMKMVKSVGSKLDDRIKAGDISESELMDDAQEMMKKMKDIPGFGDINGLLSKMGINPSKVNMNAMSAHMEREMKKNAAKERMRKKMSKNSKPDGMDKGDEPQPENSGESVDDIVKWIEKSDNEKVFKVDGGAERSTRSDKPKKKKKKKNK